MKGFDFQEAKQALEEPGPIRPSRVPLTQICSESAYTRGEILVEERSENAELGVAVHDRLAAILKSNDPPATPPDVDAAEVDRLTAYGLVAWGKLRRYFEPIGYEVEEKLDGIPRGGEGGVIKGGTADVLAVDLTNARGIDWKTGLIRPGDRYQACAYADLVFAAYPSVERVSWAIVYVREWEHVVYDFSRADCDAMKAELAEKLAKPSYTAGEHCAHCPRVECKARRAWLQASAFTALSIIDDKTLAETPGNALEAIRGLEKLCKSAKAALKTAAKAEPDQTYGDIRLVSQDVREFSPLAGWSVASAFIPESKLRGLIKMPVTAIESEIRSNGGKAGVERFREEMKQAGAISTKKRETLERISEPG